MSKQEIPSTTEKKRLLSLFDKSILCEDSEIILRKAIVDDCEPYYQLKKEYAYVRYAFTKPE